MSHHGGYPPPQNGGATYGARNYGHRSSGRSRAHAHNTSNSSQSTAASSNNKKQPDFSLHNGVRTQPSRSSGRRSSGQRSSGRRQRAPMSQNQQQQQHQHQHGYSNHGASFETASSVSSNNSYMPATTISSGGTNNSFTTNNTSSPHQHTAPSRPPQKKGIFNLSGRGLGASIAIIAGIVMGGTGLLMLVLGFSGGTAMLFMGPALMVVGIISVGVGAGLCICCKGKKDESEDKEAAKDPSFDDLESSQNTSTNSFQPAMLGGGNVNVGYNVDSAEDSMDTVPTVSSNVQQFPSGGYTQPYLVPAPAPAPAPTPAAALLTNPQPQEFSAPQMVQPVFATPMQSAVAQPAPNSVVVSQPIPVRTIPIQSPTAQVNDENKNIVGNGKVEPKVIKPRAKLSPINPQPEPETAKPKPTVKLPVPVRAPVVNLNPMPVPKQTGRKRSSSPGMSPGVSPGVSPGLGTPQSSFSENSEFSSSADESGNRVNSSVETDASATDNSSRARRIKKRVSFSDEDKKAKKAKRKLRNSQENDLRNSRDSDSGPRGILASKSSAEDYKYIGPPNAVKENTRLNRGRSQSPGVERRSQRSSKRSRSQSPHNNAHFLRQQAVAAVASGRTVSSSSNAHSLHNGPRAPTAATRKPVAAATDENDPAVQSRRRRNSRRRSKERAQPQSPTEQQPQQGFVNQAMEMDPNSPTNSPEHYPHAQPAATSSPTHMDNNNTDKGVNSWAPIHASTPPGSPKPPQSLQLVAMHTNSSTETEI